MPNPRPMHHTTGNHATRSELLSDVHRLRSIDMNWTEIGQYVGVSPRTAKRCHEEVEAAIKAARAEAYRVAQAAGREVTVGAEAVSHLPTATKLYAAIILALLIVCAIGAFASHLHG